MAMDSPSKLVLRWCPPQPRRARIVRLQHWVTTTAQKTMYRGGSPQIWMKIFQGRDQCTWPLAPVSLSGRSQPSGFRAENHWQVRSQWCQLGISAHSGHVLATVQSCSAHTIRTRSSEDFWPSLHFTLIGRTVHTIRTKSSEADLNFIEIKKYLEFPLLLCVFRLTFTFKNECCFKEWRTD